MKVVRNQQHPGELKGWGKGEGSGGGNTFSSALSNVMKVCGLIWNIFG